MAESRIPSTERIETQSAQRRQRIISNKLRQQQAQQIPTRTRIAEMTDAIMTNPFKNFKSLEEHKAKKRDTETTQRKKEIEEAIESVEHLEETAERYQKQNNEFQKKSLLLLRERITEDDTAEEILKKVLEFYPDKTLAYEALDFLIETSKPQLLAKFIEAKEIFLSQFEREIIAGKNIEIQARNFSEKGLGSPTTLRDLYREITGNPRPAKTLFNELADKFAYSLLKPVTSFLLHSLGADLKSKGPSIPKAELIQLLDNTRTVQAILGIYRFFKSRMRLIRQQFSQNDLTIPSRLTFEEIAKQFISLLGERYIASTRILQLARNLDLSEDIIAQIIVFTQMRDAIRQIAFRLFKNKQHREDLLEAILEALEELEEEEEKEK